MSQHQLVNLIAQADAAINAEDFDAIMTFYANEAILVIEPGRFVTGHSAIRSAFIAIAEHFTHTLHVSQEDVLVLEGANTALVLAKTRVRATLKSGGRADARSVKWLQYLERQVGVSCGCGQVHLRADNVLLGCTHTGLRQGDHGATDCTQIRQRKRRFSPDRKRKK